MVVREAALFVSSPQGLAVFQFRFVLDKSEGSNEPRPSLNDHRVRHWMRWAMAIFYFVAGVVHLRRPEAFLPIMPDWVPAPREVILFTGACEIAGALALLTRSLRWWAGVMLALYAVCVFPANIKHPRCALARVVKYFSWPATGTVLRRQSRTSREDTGRRHRSFERRGR